MPCRKIRECLIERFEAQGLACPPERRGEGGMCYGVYCGVCGGDICARSPYRPDDIGLCGKCHASGALTYWMERKQNRDMGPHWKYIYAGPPFTPRWMK